jgi:hypothetical protein
MNIMEEIDYSGAYQRIESGTGSVDDFFLCERPIYEKIVSAAKTNLSKNYSHKDILIDKIKCHPEKVLAVARPKLEGNLTPTEEKIFRAGMHFDMYGRTLDHLVGLLGEVTQEYESGFLPKLDIRKAPRYTNRAKKGTLKRLEELKNVLVELNLDTSWLCSQEKLEEMVGIIDDAYRFKSTAHGQLYSQKDLETALA